MNASTIRLKTPDRNGDIARFRKRTVVERDGTTVGDVSVKCRRNVGEHP
jgi:hypothetical protein